MLIHFPELARNASLNLLLASWQYIREHIRTVLHSKDSRNFTRTHRLIEYLPFIVEKEMVNITNTNVVFLFSAQIFSLSFPFRGEISPRVPCEWVCVVSHLCVCYPHANYDSVPHYSQKVAFKLPPPKCSFVGNTTCRGLLQRTFLQYLSYNVCIYL